MNHKQIRIGIDVGGTFTDAVAIDNETFEVLSKVKNAHHAPRQTRGRQRDCPDHSADYERERDSSR
ncbi:hydantoinase/oxoprolinase N-terminal domain-containing protein [Paenibacillus rhizoplanae]